MRIIELIMKLAQKVFMNFVGTPPPSMAHMEGTSVKTSNDMNKLEKQLKNRTQREE